MLLGYFACCIDSFWLASFTWRSSDHRVNAIDDWWYEVRLASWCPVITELILSFLFCLVDLLSCGLFQGKMWSIEKLEKGVLCKSQGQRHWWLVIWGSPPDDALSSPAPIWILMRCTAVDPNTLFLEAEFYSNTVQRILLGHAADVQHSPLAWRRG